VKKELQKIFPEFKLIKKNELRQKALSVWEEAVLRGGWTVNDLKDIPFTVHIPDCPVNIIDHIRSVTCISMESAKILERHNSGFYQIDYDLLVCGCLLHDVGKLLEYERTPSGIAMSRCGKLLRHPFSGAGLAMKHDLPEEVIHMIAGHAKEGDAGYRCPEAVIVHHADFMNFDSIRMGPII
jgi:putative nucleotidyltransferase with HDIG domain